MKIVNKVDKKMKKGFTLIELLAVIVILAIIAVIAVPIVLNIINDSKESATLRSAEMYIKSAELSIAQSTLKNKNITDGTYNLKDGDICLNTGCTDKLEVEVSGKVPDSGTITMLNGNISELSLVLDGKEIYKNDKGELVYLKKLNDICKPAKEQFFATSPLEAGYEYECEVKPGTKYNFYVLSREEDGSINLIMDRNINSDGTPVTKAIHLDDKDENGGIYNYVAWINQDDYGTLYPNDDDICWEESVCALTNKGPITAMNFLDNATSDWSNIPNLNLTYNDELERFTNFKITGKARLPYESEVSEYDWDEGTNGYLYNHLQVDCCDEEENEVACEDADHIYGIVGERIENIDGIYGYWTLSSCPDFSDFAWAVDYNGIVNIDFVDNDHVGNDLVYGARPVINLKI